MFCKPVSIFHVIFIRQIEAIWPRNSLGLIKKRDANSYNTMCPGTF